MGNDDVSDTDYCPRHTWSPSSAAVSRHHKYYTKAKNLDHNHITPFDIAVSSITMADYRPSPPQVQEQDLRGKVALITYAIFPSCISFLATILSVNLLSLNVLNTNKLSWFDDVSYLSQVLSTFIVISFCFFMLLSVHLTLTRIEWRHFLSQ